MKTSLNQNADHAPAVEHRGARRLARSGWRVLAFALLCAGPLRGDSVQEFLPVVPGDLLVSTIMSTLGSAATARAEDLAKFPPPENSVGERFGVLRVGVVLNAPAKLTLEVTCEKFLEPSTLTADLPVGLRYLWPKLRWKTDRLYALQEQEPAVMTFRLLDGSGVELQREDKVILLHALNECMTAVGSRTAHWNVAAYIDEGHPAVDGILQEAVRKNYVERFLGAKAPSAEVELQEMRAIWRVLQDRGLRYSSMAKAFSGFTGMKTQHIRLIDDTLAGGQANCVDGSVLFASIFQHLGFETLLVFYPSHCQVEVKLPHFGMFPIETTRLGTGSTVDDAAREAMKRIQTLLPRFRSNVPGYEFIVVAHARNIGVLPLPSRAAVAAMAAQR